MTEHSQAAGAPPVSGAVRLIFEFEGDDVRLLSQQPVDVAVTGFDIATRPRPGHYVELRDDAGDVLTRVPARAAFPTSAEVFTSEPDEPIARVDLERPSGAFTVVVPAPAATREIAVIRVEPPAQPAHVTAEVTSVAPGEVEVVELAEFPWTPGA